MFKKFAVLCVLICMGLAMVGCAGSKKAEPPKDKIAAPKDAPANATADKVEAPQ